MQTSILLHRIIRHVPKDRKFIKLICFTISSRCSQLKLLFFNIKKYLKKRYLNSGSYTSVNTVCHDLEIRLYHTMAKEESCILFLVFCLVTQKFNISCNCCCLSSHISFIHIFAIVYFPFHINSTPLFKKLMCCVSEARSELSFD